MGAALKYDAVASDGVGSPRLLVARRRISIVRRGPYGKSTPGNLVAGERPANTKSMNSSALRKGVVGVRMSRKSCVAASSIPEMIFFPETPISLIATPRTSGLLSALRALDPFEKRTYAG